MKFPNEMVKLLGVRGGGELVSFYYLYLSFSLVSEHIIFVFLTFFLSDFTESQHLVKVNALTLTFDFSSPNTFQNS